MSEDETPQLNRPVKLSIKRKEGAVGMVTMPADLDITLNGQPLPLCYGIAIDIQPLNVVTAVVSLYADVELEDLGVLLSAQKAEQEAEEAAKPE